MHAVFGNVYIIRQKTNAVFFKLSRNTRERRAKNKVWVQMQEKTEFNQQKGRHRPKTELKHSIIQTDRVAGVWCLNRPSGWATAVCVCE